MTPPATRQHPVTVRVFTQRFSATPLGARLARHLALNQLHDWGIPHGSRASDTAAVIVAELSSNAVTHGRVPGRDFELPLSLIPGSLRIEVTDTRTEARPPGPSAVKPPEPLADSGRGLVEALADRWEILDREPPGKTVQAEIDLPRWLSLFKQHLNPSDGAPAYGRDFDRELDDARETLS
ncbi:ATP-binding protein [Streptomyces pseudoechinosporeus]